MEPRNTLKSNAMIAPVMTTVQEATKAAIHIVGTSHIAKQSAQEIERAFRSFQPDIVAVELDMRRLTALRDQATGKKDNRIPISLVRQIGVTGYVFAILGRAVQKRMGNVLNVNPGVDMLTAVTLAEENKKQLHLVDQEILITMRHLSNQFKFREKMRVVWDIVSAPFSREKISIQFDKVPEEKVIKKVMELLKNRYPSIYNVLIVERNIVMARNLDVIVRRNPGKKILLVIGAGHDEDLRLRLRNMENIAAIEN